MAKQTPSIQAPIRYSFQSEKLIANLKEFDNQDFLVWFFERSPYTIIGSKHILNYLVDKKQ